MNATAEDQRLEATRQGHADWRHWGPYLSERQWGTVREDYSAKGTPWLYLPYEHARSHAYRWGEEGIAGISDSRQQLCFSLALWNGADATLKERLYGLTTDQGNHGEDVKEVYFYLDNLPSHAYMKFLYKYPQRAFPYEQLLAENRRRGRDEPEYELLDTGIFDDDRYFDVVIEYAKAAPDDVLIRITASNRGPQAASLHLLPSLWFRNDWSWYPGHARPDIVIAGQDAKGITLAATHADLGTYCLNAEAPDAALFTHNETNLQRLYQVANASPYVKDGINDAVVDGRLDAVNPAQSGTKAALHYIRQIAPGESVTLRLRLRLQPAGSDTVTMPEADFDALFALRLREADEFYRRVTPFDLPDDMRQVQRQAFAGLLWNKQYYRYHVYRWLEGDAPGPTPPAERLSGRNSSWEHFAAGDVLSMPDKWEYPWFAAWDMAFHAVSFAMIDPEFAKAQLLLLTREWYMHPNGQIPAYEWRFGDVNPPVHAWAALRVYQIERKMLGRQDRGFLERIFQKLLLNFTWWVNRTDADGDNVFSGGFLGLDNIGAFDRSHFPKSLGELKQSDATAWMGFFSLRMLQISFELAATNQAYQGIASKFFEHFVAIVNSVNSDCGQGLWHAEDRFYYDFVRPHHGAPIPMRVRSLVGLLPMIAVELLDKEQLHVKGRFKKRMDWFLKESPSLARHLQYSEDGSRVLLSLVPRSRLISLLERMFDENEFLSPFGIRSLSRVHEKEPFRIDYQQQRFQVRYEPGESQTAMFGGNSNWRGPIWFPINYLLVDALKRYYAFYGDELKVELPTGSGCRVTLLEAARELERRLVSLFQADPDGRIPAVPELSLKSARSLWTEGRLFHEYFHAETGKGLGSCHQTGWTALVASCLEDLQEPLHTSACQTSL